MRLFFWAEIVPTQSTVMQGERIIIIKQEPDTFLTQKRHPFHHFVNFVKFASLGLGIVYAGQQMLKREEK